MELIVLADTSVCPGFSQCRSLGVYGAVLRHLSGVSVAVMLDCTHLAAALVTR